jgi:hypothetical protein
MKYKRLSIGELKELEKEFVNFLSSAQITGKDWEQLKKNEIDKAVEFIDVFSDMVYDKVMSKIKYLEYRDKKALNIYNCLGDKIVLIGLRIKEHSVLDLTSPDVYSQWSEHHTSSVNIIRSEKKYSKERGVEVFELIQTGCLVTDDRLFNLLNGMV